MLCPWKASHLQLLLTVPVFLVTDCISEGAESTSSPSLVPHANEQTSRSYRNPASSTLEGKQFCVIQTPPTEVRTRETVSVDAKVVLSCPAVPSSCVILATWLIDVGGKSTCTLAYNGDHCKSNNCTDNRISWASSPDQNPALQIDPVALSHEGTYICEIVTQGGNFHHAYGLQVLVVPEVSTLAMNRTTVVCKAAAGKPAAWISWTPEEACAFTEQQRYRSNETVTVQSTCHLAENSVSAVNCSVFHVAANRTISIQLSQGNDSISSKIEYLCYISPVFIILVIMGSIWFLKSYDCRKCKLKEREDSLVVEDEMQPYASYSEKNNPLYDTTDRTKMPQV